MKGIFTKAAIATLFIGQASSFAMENYFDKDVQKQLAATLKNWNSKKFAISSPVAVQIAPVAPVSIETDVAVAAGEIQTLVQPVSYWQMAKNFVQGREAISWENIKQSQAAAFCTKIWNYASESAAGKQCAKAINTVSPYVTRAAQAVKPYTLDVVTEHPYISAAIAAGAVVGTTGYIYRKPIAKAINNAIRKGKAWFSSADTNEQIVKFKVILGTIRSNENTSRFFLTQSNDLQIKEYQEKMRDLFNARTMGRYINTCETIKVEDPRFEYMVLQIIKETVTVLSQLQ